MEREPNLASQFWARVARLPRPLVLACGCFDLLTVGHIRHLKAARGLGNSLVVIVTDDKNVSARKPGRPILPEDVRVEMVEALACVDVAIVYRHSTAVPAILALRPDTYVKGGDYRGSNNLTLGLEITAVQGMGGRIEFTDTDCYHTTELMERIHANRLDARKADPVRG